MFGRTTKILAVVLLVGIVATESLALEVTYQYRESQVKTAFLFNFTKFITWPETAFGDSRSPLVLAVFDPELYTVASESLAGRQVGGRGLEVRKVAAIDEALDSHLLFIGAAEASRLDELLAVVAERPILTVSDIDGFAARGGMVELFQEERKLRFGVKLAAVRKAGLNISSEVLHLASFVLAANGGEKR
ncbi:MAG TPA: YfiR family protein [Desulfuromonadales bacterium]|nr:YfiR family protein [Desulfuromonadales bacterium]